MPNFIDSLNSIDNYDALLLSVKSNQLISVLKEYNEYFKKDSGVYYAKHRT